MLLKEIKFGLKIMFLILNQFYNDILYYRSNGIPNKKKRKSLRNDDEPVSKRTQVKFI